MREVLNNNTLSLKAKGLYAIICLNTFDSITLDKLCEYSSDGRDSTTNARKQLVKHGYLKNERIRKDGKFCGGKWVLSNEISE